MCGGTKTHLRDTFFPDLSTKVLQVDAPRNQIFLPQLHQLRREGRWDEWMKSLPFSSSTDQPASRMPATAQKPPPRPSRCKPELQGADLVVLGNRIKAQNLVVPRSQSKHASSPSHWA